MRVSGGVVLLLTCSATLCCQRSAGTAAGFDAAGRFVEVEQARTELVAARAKLEALSQRHTGVTGAPAVDAPPAEATAAFERAFDRYQHVLAAYLSEALAYAPRAGETRRALDLYGGEALRNAAELAERGDTRRAAAVLRGARSYFAVAGIAAPREITEALDRLTRKSGAETVTSP